MPRRDPGRRAARSLSRVRAARRARPGDLTRGHPAASSSRRAPEPRGAAPPAPRPRRLRADRPRRHGDGLPGEAQAPGPSRRGEGAPRPPAGRPVVRRALRPRGADDGAPRPSAHRPGLRLRTPGGPLLPRDGARGRGEPAAGAGRRRVHPGAVPRDRAAHLRGAAVRARPGGGAPRHQAREHPARPLRVAEDRRLRPRPADPIGHRDASDPAGPRAGHPALHGARADRAPRRGGPPRRHLRPRGRLLRDADRRAAARPLPPRRRRGSRSTSASTRSCCAPSRRSRAGGTSTRAS